MRVILTDMSGTLTKGSPVLGLVKWVERHQSKLRARLYLARTMPTYPLARRGWIDWAGWTDRLMVNALPLIHGASEETLQQMAEWTVEQELWPKRRSDVLARLARHRQDGARIILVTSIYEPTAAAFARRIGAEHIATPLRLQDGRVRLAAEPVAGPLKMEQVRRLLGEEPVYAAYGDTRSDIPMLSIAQHPAAVYPDPILRQAAQERGWEIIES